MNSASNKTVSAAVKATNDSDWQATKWKIRERMELMFNNELLADVYFIVGRSTTKKSASERVRIPAHKFILATGSKVFYTMFYGSVCEKKDEIEIPDVELSAFLILLRYLYSDEVKLKADSVLATLYAAKKYHVPHLIEACTQYLKTNVDKTNACSLLNQSLFFNVPDLTNKCWEVIDAETKSALEAGTFLEIDIKTLESILKRDTLGCSEIWIFKAALKWAGAECNRTDLQLTHANKRAVLGDLFKLIRFPTMSSDEFANKIAPLGILSTEETNKIFMYLMSNSKPSLIFPTEPRCRYVIYEIYPDLPQQYLGAPPFTNTSNSILKDTVGFTVDKKVFLLGYGIFAPCREKSVLQVTFTVESPYHQREPVNKTDTKMLSHEGSGILRVLFENPVRIDPHCNYTSCIQISNTPMYTGLYNASYTRNTKPVEGISFRASNNGYYGGGPKHGFLTQFIFNTQ